MLQLEHKYILVIDVAEDIREIVRCSLKNKTYWQVLSANSIAEGLASIEIRQPDVILLEATLMDECDPTIWQQLQTIASTQSVPIIFMASRVRAMDRLKFQQLGVATAIAKPFDPKDLVETISQLLNV